MIIWSQWPKITDFIIIICNDFNDLLQNIQFGPQQLLTVKLPRQKMKMNTNFHTFSLTCVFIFFIGNLFINKWFHCQGSEKHTDFKIALNGVANC
jgi:hypothetical protein